VGKTLIRIGVIGVGRWGKNHVRALKELEQEVDIELKAVCDIREEVAKNVSKEFGVPIALSDCREILAHIDAAIIATSIDSLSHVARMVLEQGKHALIEKPVATTSKEALELLEIANRNKVVAMPGMIMRFNDSVNKLKELLKNSKLIYLSFRRLSRRPSYMTKYPLLLDLGIHDIDLCRYLTEDEVEEVLTAYRAKVADDEIVVAVVKTENGIPCHIHIDGVSPYKVREVDAITSEAFIRVDTNTNRLTILKPGAERVIEVENREPLKQELLWFIELVKRGSMDYKPNLIDAVKNLTVIEAIMSRA
jgi:UDP-N-acetylglucosamine 3-dehydrogenase